MWSQFATRPLDCPAGWNYGAMWPMWLWGGLLTVLLLVAVGLVVWFAAARGGAQRKDRTDTTAGAQRILAERFARGELTAEQYQEQLQVLR